MKIEQPTVQIKFAPSEEVLLNHLEDCARVAYQSHDRTKDGSAAKLLKKIVVDAKTPHDSVLEHVSMTVEFKLDRGLATELLRHRHSYTHESTRWINYSKKKFAGIKTAQLPVDNLEARLEYKRAMEYAERSYLNLVDAGIAPEFARMVLPLGLMGDLVMTANFREWLLIIDLRSKPNVHPVLRDLMHQLAKQFAEKYPVFASRLLLGN